MPGWLTWILKTAAEKLFGAMFDWKKAAAWFSMWLVAFAVSARSWLRGSYVVKGWFLAAIFAYAAVLTVIAAAFVYGAVQRSRKFKEVRVEDPRSGLEWRLLQNPDAWAHKRIASYFPAQK
jgi:hypothetical protein